jgi:drug/metabolite transporter (DMT)-like permease
MLEVVLAMALAGSSVVVGKLLSVRVPVFLSVELCLIAALAAILPAQIARRREIRLLGARELLLMFLQALFGMVLFRAFTLTGLRFTSAVNAGVITSAAPAVMAVLARAVLGERMGRTGSLGVCLAVAGLLFINLFGMAGGAEPGHILGNLLVLAATVCEALLTIFRKTSGGRISSVTNTTILVGMSAVMLLPLALLDLKGFDLGRVGTVGWLSVVYYGAFATVIAYILWGDGALRIPANRTGIATAAMPVSALVLSALVLGEPLRFPHIAGCAAVVAGMIIASRPRPKKETNNGKECAEYRAAGKECAGYRAAGRECAEYRAGHGSIGELEKAVSRGRDRCSPHEGRAQSPGARGA